MLAASVITLPGYCRKDHPISATIQMTAEQFYQRNGFRPNSIILHAHEWEALKQELKDMCRIPVSDTEKTAEFWGMQILLLPTA